MWNWAHVHLMLNHIPVLGVPFGLALLIVGLVRKNETLIRSALVVFAVVAALTVIVYETGEPAEEVVEHMPGITESRINTHEESAEASLAVTSILGIVALAGALRFRRSGSVPRWFALSTLLLGLVTVGFLSWTAFLGGEIHHPETRPGFRPPAEAGETGGAGGG